jgi:hypothetical protein
VGVEVQHLRADLHFDCRHSCNTTMARHRWYGPLKTRTHGGISATTAS